MKKTLIKCFIFLAMLGVCLPSMAAAMMVGPEAFGDGTITEGFEGLSPNTANTGSREYGNFFAIGTATAYVFDSGVTLVNPRAVSVADGGPYIEDFRWTGGYNDWKANGNATAAPFGQAYIGIWGGATYLEFTFSQPMLRVGAYVDGAPGTVTMEVYGASGLIEFTTLATGLVSDWGTATAFIGLEDQGITRVILRGDDIGLDNLMFGHVPLPPTMLLLGTGLLGLLGLRRKSRSHKDDPN